MLSTKPLNRILFIDIETSSQKEKFSDLTEIMQSIFKRKFKKDIESKIEIEIQKQNLQKEKSRSLNEITKSVHEEVYNTKSPISSELGRIICISVGAIFQNPGQNFYNIKITSFFDQDEKILLSNFINHEKLGPILNKIQGKYEKNPDDCWALCAFNGKVYDFPFIAKRLIINGFQLPAMFDYAHLKPWEQMHLLDPKESWKFSVWDASSSLEMMCAVFGIPSSKDDISGEDVKDVFWKEKDLERIKVYCEKDVIALASVYLRMKSMSEEVRLFKEKV